MSTRSTDPRLQELYDSGEQIYSISRLDCINNCLYESYRTYIKKDRGQENIYSCLGGKTHDVLEKIVNGEATEKDLLPVVDEELYYADLLGLHFPKDMRGGDSIKDGWVANMKHFCETYKSPVGKNLVTEQLFIYKTPKGRYLQGYIDLQSINNDGTISIYDYKTSSMYTSSAIQEHGRQLVLYQLGKEQEGYKVRDVAWIFLKYVDIIYNGYKTAKSKSKSVIKKTVERRKIGKEFNLIVQKMLEEKGYDEFDIERISEEFVRSNKFDTLPEDIRSEFIVRPCVYKYEVTDEVKQECIDYIDDTIDMWESLDSENLSEYSHRDFFDSKGKEDIFYCSFLCGHRKDCEHFKYYMDSKNEKNEDDDLF